MHQCLKCQGLVPESQSSCPHCRSTPKWWSLPLTIAGGAMAAVTLSACYGPACATTVTLPDGGLRRVNSYTCEPSYDCRVAPDGGAREHDGEWLTLCTDSQVVIADAGRDGGSDGGTDGGIDGGP